MKRRPFLKSLLAGVVAAVTGKAAASESVVDLVTDLKTDTESFDKRLEGFHGWTAEVVTDPQLLEREFTISLDDLCLLNSQRELSGKNSDGVTEIVPTLLSSYSNDKPDWICYHLSAEVRDCDTEKCTVVAVFYQERFNGFVENRSVTMMAKRLDDLPAPTRDGRWKDW